MPTRTADTPHAHHEGPQFHEKVRPAHPVPQLLREKVRPAHLKRAFFAHIGLAGRTFSRSHPTPGRAGRKTSLTARRNMATMKPTTPLPTPNKTPLKPPSPLRPKTAPKTPISRPQRRWWFQTTGPPRLQHPHAAPMVGGGGASPRHPWAISITNVVKPTRFKSPLEDLCDKRRQSKPKNHHFQRKSPRIDDVCNNGAEIHTKNTSN